ncbi:MAG: carbohydrate-binding domain-containing protein [Clostridia bacterium]|nr:carbohydrate-binding domain-containing protein [Clostridia bacterium]
MKSRQNIRFVPLCAAFLAALSMTACGENNTPVAETAEPVQWTDLSYLSEKTEEWNTADACRIVLSDDGIRIDGQGAAAQGSTLMISVGGVYIISGTLTDGQIVVNAPKDDSVRILLDGVTVSTTASSAVYIAQAKNAYIRTAVGSVNTFAATGSETRIDSVNVDAAVFSRDDLFLDGEGTLRIGSTAGHGVVSKDDLSILGGTYEIHSDAGHGFSVKDDLRITDGSFTVTSEKDGFHAENKDDTTLGNIYITGGEFRVTSGGDGFDAAAEMQVLGGIYRIVTGGGASAAAAHPQDSFGGRGGWGQQSTQSQTDSISQKGFKAGVSLSVGGGDFDLDTSDDALHTNGDLTVTDGSFSISTGDDGMHADNILRVDGGEITIGKSYEGLEGGKIYITDGIISLRSSDDGINAAGGADGSGFGFGGGMMEYDANAYIEISGGTLYVNADGDGIDSNGTMWILGGDITVEGPTNSGNGALDTGSSASVGGGTILAVGSSGMAVGFDQNSTQGAMLVNFPASIQGGVIRLTDADGRVIFEKEVSKTFSSVVLSTPDITQGETYILTAGDQSVTVEMTGITYGTSGGMGGFGGRGDKGGMDGRDPGAGGFQKGDRGQWGAQGGMHGDMPGEIPGNVPGGVPGDNMPDGELPPEMPEGVPGGDMPGWNRKQ